MKSLPHEKTTQMFASLGRVFDIELEELDIEKWSAAFTIARAIDDIVDEDHIYSSGLYFEQLISGNTIPYMTDEEAIFVRSTYEKLSEGSKHEWRRSTSELGAFAIKRLEAETADEYMQVVCDESPLMANVLLVENGGERDDSGQRDTFNSWLGQMSRTAFVLDTCSDFIKDHNEGNMNIQPTPRAVMTLGRYAAVETLKFVAISPPAIYPVLMQRFITKTQEKTKQPDFWTKQYKWQ